MNHKIIYNVSKYCIIHSMVQINMNVVTEFEHKISQFFNSPYAVAVDSCTHGIELCLRLSNTSKINVPVRTYLSIPMLAKKLNIGLEWRDERWEDYYTLNYNDKHIIDAAVLWKKDSYLPNTYMCLSFQHQKHLSLGRGGIILLDNEQDAIQLKKMSYDGRLPNIPWREQNIDTMGYHYYMTPETAQQGLDRLSNAINTEPRKWKYEDWPNLSEMKFFQK
jgi:dTDP-4-amino-4,6-dideoxygalactose transaminase